MSFAPFLGVLLHAIGGFAAGSFYVPLKKVRHWAWESFWLVMGLAAWIAAPWVGAWLTTPGLFEVLGNGSAKAWGLCLLFGFFWGLGNLTFGLSVRYLGMALGYAIALGFCMAVGTLTPPIVSGEFVRVVSTLSGGTVLAGVTACLLGIGVCGLAGMLRENELRAQDAQGNAQEYVFGRGILVAAMSGILSACFAFGLAAGKPVAEAAIENGTQPLYSNNAVLVMVLLGGFCSNAAWCLLLNVKNGSFSDYLPGVSGSQAQNYLLCVLGGVTWYLQFFFYGMGTTKLGEDYGFSSWSIHMAFIIVCSNLWGIYFQEWKGTSIGTKLLVWSGIGILILSTAVIGLGNYLAL